MVIIISRESVHRPFPSWTIGVLLCGIVLGGGGAGFNGLAAPRSPSYTAREIVVNSLDDLLSPPAGTVTLRFALDAVRSGRKITFHPSLNGGTIRLSIVGSAHSVLKGEVFVMGKFQGYGERDYGNSALYVRKNVVIDASGLPAGIMIAWDGGDSNRARVLAVYGDLTMQNVTITSGYASSEPTGDDTQPFTLGRGGALAIWGKATLSRCTFSGNRAEGDENASRDRGAFGGAIYGNLLALTDCVVSGNSVIGYGAAGGGVYSVGGAETLGASSLTRCTISGNRIVGQHAYGGGVYSDGGGPGNKRFLTLQNCTIARNAVADHPNIGEPPGSQYYYRGGGVYMSNGSLRVTSCTIVENTVTGHAALFKNKPNMGGGGMTATIGDAHVVEAMEIWHSIIAGNTVNDAADDVYTGSLLYFYSFGYNRIGKLDFSQILVPIPPWWSLSRKHWPKAGDQDGVELSQVVALDEIARHDSIVSAGVDQGEKAVLWYPPFGSARDQIPRTTYAVRSVNAQYRVLPNQTDGFLNLVLERLRTDYASVLGSDFGADFGDMSGVAFSPVPNTWPAEASNAAWIKFWRDLDVEIDNRLGTVGLGDAFWGSFAVNQSQAGVRMSILSENRSIRLLGSDQLGHRRPTGNSGDIGAIER